MGTIHSKKLVFLVFSAAACTVWQFLYYNSSINTFAYMWWHKLKNYFQCTDDFQLGNGNY